MPSKQSQNRQPGQHGSGLPGRWRKLAALASVILILLAGFWLLSQTGAENTAPGSADHSNPAHLANSNNGKAANQPAPANLPGNASDSASPDSPAQKLLLARRQLELAEHTYTSYRDSTKYPPQSRPISEHPDQVYPNRPIEEERALRKPNGEVDANIRIKTGQSRVFVGARENVVFFLSAYNKNHDALPITITSARAEGIAVKGAKPSASLSFADNGNTSAHGDLQAGDNQHAALLQPSNSAFASFNGTVRVQVAFQVGDQNGIAVYDFIYTPEQPATWAEGIREVQENGALVFYLKVQVRQPGRYMVNARLDDAAGKPLALLSFNDMLAAGTQEVRLPAFGKLLRDAQASFPLTLRDVDAWLLKEDADPDRALLPRLIGKVHVSKTYMLASFSDAEWESEQRSRYLQELGKDVEQARSELNKLGGS